jgi:methyl-accepting chemotaxis protein
MARRRNRIEGMSMWQMLNFQRRTLRARLTLGFGVILALLLGVAAIGGAALTSSLHLQSRTVRAIDAQQLVQALLLEVTLDEVRTLAVIRSAGMPEVVSRFRPEMARSAVRVRALLLPLASAAPGAASAAEPALDDDYTRYLAARDKVLNLVETGQTTAASQAEATLFAPAREAWSQGVQALSQAMDARAQTALADASRIGQRASAALLALSLVALLAGLVWARLISASIALPILSALRLSRSIASGDLRQHPECEAGFAGEGGEPGLLLQSLLSMRLSLLAMSRATAQSAAGVSTASGSMLLAAQSLALRTEDQTRSIEAARAMVMSVVAQIRSTAENAKAGEAHCIRLHDATQSGQAAAQHAVATIERVAQRSVDMDEVISLIESIAFQINILSLNAAVEAARAGSAGAGFAVVATEVRSLAKRATESARSIRALIHGAAEQMRLGLDTVQTVESLLQTMGTMVAEVAERSRHISAQTRDQTESLALASAGLTRLATLNAANADMVVTTVDGCESLSAGAEVLLARMAMMHADPAPGSPGSPGPLSTAAATRVERHADSLVAV